MFDKLKGLFKSKTNADVPHVPHYDESEGAGDLFLWIIALVLLAFTMYRTAHLISDTLPDEAKIMAFAALAALDAGSLAWLVFANRTFGARHDLALLMVAIDLFGVGASAIADTALVVGVNREIVEAVAIWAVPIIVIANVAAIFVAKALNPSRKAREAERKAREAESLREARIEYERRRVLDEIERAEREAELSMLRNRAALMRQHSASRYSLAGEDGDGEPGENGRRREMAADGTDMPTNKRSKAAPKG